MSKVFLDSNILLYLYSIDEPTKKRISENLIQNYDQICISTQVLFEFTNIAHKKFKFNYPEIEKALHEFHNGFNVCIITFVTLQNAIKIASKNKYSFVDSLILSSALENKCSTLFTEDMHASHVIDRSLQIINPFI